MKFTVSRTEFAAALKTCAPATKSAGLIPILSYVLLSPGGERLNLRATDTNITLMTSCPASVTGNAVPVAVDHGLLFGLVKSFGADEITFAVKENGRIGIECGTSKYELPTLPGDDFPVPAGHEPLGGIEVGAAHLADVARASLFAVNPHEQRFSLNGLWLFRVGRRFMVYVSDGYRMLARELRAQSDDEFASKAIALLPANGLRAYTSIGIR